MEERSGGGTIRIKSNDVYRTRQQGIAASRWILAKKLIRAAHAKEKQLLEELVQPPESP
jgi:hypothetical protein